MSVTLPPLEKLGLSQIVWSDPDRLGGTVCFAGTRVPVQALFDYLEGNETLEDFLSDFPGVTRAQALSALEVGRRELLKYAAR